METIRTLGAWEIEIREKSDYELKLEKERKFQEGLAKALIYYCSDGGKDYLPTDEKLFLTAVVRGLVDIVVGIEGLEISPYLFSQDWRNDIEEILIEMEEMIESGAFKELFSGWSYLCFSMKEILNLEDYDDPTGGGEYKALLMTIFKNLRNNLGYSGKSFKFSQKAREYVEKNIIPNLTPNFANLAPNLSVIFFVKILAEKAKKYFKKDIEPKSYIDRE